MAEKFVYNGINPNETPSPAYMARGREVINQQLAVGGYRLYDQIVTLYANRKGEVEFSE